MEWPDLHASGGTLAIYMPGDDYLQISESLQRAGLDAATPCVVVSHATLPSQRLRSTTIGHLATRPPMPAPSLLIVGPVARAAGDHDAFPTMQDGRSVSSSLSAESPS